MIQNSQIRNIIREYFAWQEGDLAPSDLEKIHSDYDQTILWRIYKLIDKLDTKDPDMGIVSMGAKIHNSLYKTKSFEF